MRYKTTNKQLDDINCHHEAGHVCILVREDIVIRLLEKLQDGSAQVILDNPDASNRTDLYAFLVSARASRFSQPLSTHNTATEMRDAFEADEKQSDVFINIIYGLYLPLWGEPAPPYNTFKAEIEAVVDDDLARLYEDNRYKSFVKCVAKKFNGLKKSIPGNKLNEFVHECWKISGASIELTGYSKFLDVCVRDAVPSPLDRA